MPRWPFPKDEQVLKWNCKLIILRLLLSCIFKAEKLISMSKLSYQYQELKISWNNFGSLLTVTVW